jgi:hypothetical protein
MANQASVDYTLHTRLSQGTKQALDRYCVPAPTNPGKGKVTKLDILFNVNLLFKAHNKGVLYLLFFLPPPSGILTFWRYNLTARKEEPCFQNTASSSTTISSREVGLPLLNFSLEQGKLESPSPTQWELNSQPAPYSAH